MKTDWKALCAELAKELAEEYGVQREFDSGDPLLGSGAIELLSRARTALTQLETEGPTDEDERLFLLWKASSDEYLNEYLDVLWEKANKVFAEFQHRHFARALITSDAIARWGRPAIEPVPASERPILKSSNFNDANGHCWCGTRASIDKTGDLPLEMPSSWELREPCAQDDCVLPHYALPIPTATETNGQT